MSTQHSSRSAGRGRAALWASAAVLAGLVIVQAGRVWPGLLSAPEARADLVTQLGEYSLITFYGGNDDVLAVVDGRSEEVYLYQTTGQSRLEYIGRESLPDIFARGRVLGAGRK
ncbi:MAG: hypothetical protein H7Y88_05835 [Phycisphaerales bacterium]|nr:hypothetical protein [Phycisphaerales bacterium]